MGFESLVEYINELPPLPESVQKIQALYAQGDPEIKELVKLIESDPVLTADILARVNSPLFSFSKQIVSVMQAITLFGSATIRGFVLSSAMNKNFVINMNPYNISNDMFSRICTLQSALMFQWYMGVDIQNVKFLAPMAFLMEMGKVLIAKELNESEYAQMFSDELKASEDIEKTEAMYAGLTSAQVGALLFRHWCFDESFISTVEYLDEIESAPLYVKPYIDALNVVRKAVNITEQLSDTSIALAAQRVVELGLDEERFVNTAKRLQKNK